MHIYLLYIACISYEVRFIILQYYINSNILSFAKYVYSDYPLIVTKKA